MLIRVVQVGNNRHVVIFWQNIITFWILSTQMAVDNEWNWIEKFP